MEADLPPDPMQTVQKDARRTGRMSCCILERLRLDTEGNTATCFFFPMWWHSWGGFVLIYHQTPTGKKVWPLPLRASPLIKHRTERRYDEKGPVSLQHVVVYINITLLDWGFCGNRGNQLELISIVLYWLLHRQLKVAFRWLNNGGRFLKVHWTLISPCPFYI